MEPMFGFLSVFNLAESRLNGAGAFVNRKGPNTRQVQGWSKPPRMMKDYVLVVICKKSLLRGMTSYGGSRRRSQIDLTYD